MDIYKLHEMMTEIKDMHGIEELDKMLRGWHSENYSASLIVNLGFKHPTEIKYPEQTKRFREIIDEMYQTHLRKNADYSSYNINGTGLIGLTVRFWDKAARIMNLMGFDIGTGVYSGAKQNLVEDETIIDTFNDAGVYSIIARIHAEGKWGK